MLRRVAVRCQSAARHLRSPAICSKDAPATMSRRRRVLLALACAGALGVGVVVVLIREKRQPHLPSLADYETLPRAFNKALNAQWEKASSPSHVVADMRELARTLPGQSPLPGGKGLLPGGGGQPGGPFGARPLLLGGDIPGGEQPRRSRGGAQATLMAEPGYAAGAACLGRAPVQGRPDRRGGQGLCRRPRSRARISPRPRLEWRGSSSSADRTTPRVARLKELIAHHPESTSGAALLAQIIGQARRQRGLCRNAGTQPPDP